MMRDLQSLTVEARDGGGATSTVKVIVDLIDQNDNVPIIESNEYTGTVRENAAQLDKPVIITVRMFVLRNWLGNINFTNEIFQNLLLIRITEFATVKLEVLFFLTIVPFQASDLDEDANAEIGYSITGGDPSGLFRIDTATGELTLTGPLDYESMDPTSNGRYTLTVTARDAGVPQLASNGVNVIITVQVCQTIIVL